MKNRFGILLLVFTLGVMSLANAQDTVDVLKYDINLDLGNQEYNRIKGYTDIYLISAQPGLSQLKFDLIVDNVDSVLVNGSKVDTFDYDRRYLTLSTLSVNSITDTFCLTVYYSSGQKVEGYGFGGMHIASDLIYNLGVAIESDPHPYGRAWFPCRDNFYDKALFNFHITVRQGWTAQCNGLLQSVDTNTTDGSLTFHWQESKPIPTYLAAVAAGSLNTINYTLQGFNTSYPVTLLYTHQDSARVRDAFAILEDVLPKYEQCFGDYEWGKLGYVATPRGSMEHTGNIALYNYLMDSKDEQAQSVIIHELSHSWFGNQVTCASNHDMWFNEGGATFCEEVGFEAALGKEYAINYYKKILEDVILNLPNSDGGYLSLYGLPTNKTYCRTVYDKGAMVYHSLRGYLGEELFYNSIKQLLSKNKFNAMTTTAIRDSLSVYSGVDLTAFFDFHIFGPGFLNYTMDSMAVNGTSVTVYLRLRLLAATEPLAHSKVPITFFSSSMDTTSRIVEFQGVSGSQSFSLPFEPAFAIVDYTDDISDAVLTEQLSITDSRMNNMNNVYMAIKATTYKEPAWIHIDHHFVAPDSSASMHPAIKRMSKNRYWKVTGSLPGDNKITAKFLYAVHSSNSSYAYLDKGFLDRSNSVDSLILLYRPNASADWVPISVKREGNKQGYMVCDDLKQGEYTLAVGYKELVGIGEAADDTYKLTVYPNPSKGLVNINISDLKDDVDVLVTDLGGRQIGVKHMSANTTSLEWTLKPGVYLFYVVKDGSRHFVEKVVVD